MLHVLHHVGTRVCHPRYQHQPLIDDFPITIEGLPCDLWGNYSTCLNMSAKPLVVPVLHLRNILGISRDWRIDGVGLLLRVARFAG